MQRKMALVLLRVIPSSPAKPPSANSDFCGQTILRNLPPAFVHPEPHRSRHWIPPFFIEVGGSSGFSRTPRAQLEVTIQDVSGALPVWRAGRQIKVSLPGEMSTLFLACGCLKKKFPRFDTAKPCSKLPHPPQVGSELTLPGQPYLFLLGAKLLNEGRDATFADFFAAPSAQFRPRV